MSDLTRDEETAGNIFHVTLSEQDAAAFEQAEQTISEGLKTFFEVGEALIAVRENRWYRAKGYSTFEAYCNGEWQIQHSRAYQLMDAAKVVADLKTSTVVEVSQPTSERQVRPLTRIDAADRPAVWQDANEKAKAEGKPVAARHVEAAVKERQAEKQTERKPGATAPASPALSSPASSAKPAPPEPSRPELKWTGPIHRAYHHHRDGYGNERTCVVEITEKKTGEGLSCEITIDGRFFGKAGGLNGAKEKVERHLFTSSPEGGKP